MTLTRYEEVRTMPLDPAPRAYAGLYARRLGDGRLVSDLSARQVSAMRSRLHKQLAAEWPMRHAGWMHRSGARRAAHLLRVLRDA